LHNGVTEDSGLLGCCTVFVGEAVPNIAGMYFLKC